MSTYKHIPAIEPKASNVSEENVRSWAMHALFAVGMWGQRYASWLVGGVVVALIFFSFFQWSAFRTRQSAKLLDRAIALIDPAAQQAEFKKIIDTYRSSSSSHIARFLLAQDARKKGDTAIAKTLLEELRNTKELPVFFRVAVQHALALLLVDLHDARGAIALYEESAKLPGNILQLASLYQAALLHESLGESEEAKALYQRIVDGKEKGEERVKSMSKDRILWLTDQKKQPAS